MAGHSNCGLWWARRQSARVTAAFPVPRERAWEGLRCVAIGGGTGLSTVLQALFCRLLRGLRFPLLLCVAAPIHNARRSPQPPGRYVSIPPINR